MVTRHRVNLSFSTPEYDYICALSEQAQKPPTTFLADAIRYMLMRQSELPEQGRVVDPRQQDLLKR